MELTYDPHHNVAYLRLKQPRPDDADWQVQTVCVSDDLNVDLAPDGSVYGIELLSANEQLGEAAQVVIMGGTDRKRRKSVSLKVS